MSLLIAASVIVAILMILFFFTYPSIVRQRIIDEVVFKNGSDALERFRTTREIKNLRLIFHMYTVTNADQVINNNAKIKYKELGPFVYKEFKTREFIDNNQTSGLITFKPRTRYNLDLAASAGDPAQINITWPNVPLLVAQAFLDKLPYLQRKLAYFLINQAIDKKSEPAFITDTAANFLFDGSKRELFEYLQSLDKFNMFKPWPLKDNMFALLYGRNETWNYKTDFFMTMSTGFGLNQNYHDLNSYKYINGSTQMPFWKPDPPTCNQVGGTDGELFHPFLNRSSNLVVYSIDICRKLALKFKQDYYIDGIPVYKFVLDEKTLASGKSVPENSCYCLFNSTDGFPSSECLLDGLFDLSTCNNPNVIASGAHFFAGSSEKLLSRIEGVSPPNASLHEPVIFVEPNSGFAVKVKVPLQFNIRMVKNDFKLFSFFKDDEPLILPLVWVEENAELTDDQASLLKSKLLLLDSWFVSMVLGGSIIFVLAISVLAAILCIKFRDSRNALLANQEASETDPLITASIASETRSYTASSHGSNDNDRTNQPAT